MAHNADKTLESLMDRKKYLLEKRNEILSGNYKISNYSQNIQKVEDHFSNKQDSEIVTDRPVFAELDTVHPSFFENNENFDVTVVDNLISDLQTGDNASLNDYLINTENVNYTQSDSHVAIKVLPSTSKGDDGTFVFENNIFEPPTKKTKFIMDIKQKEPNQIRETLEEGRNMLESNSEIENQSEVTRSQEQDAIIDKNKDLDQIRRTPEEEINVLVSDCRIENQSEEMIQNDLSSAEDSMAEKNAQEQGNTSKRKRIRDSEKRREYDKSKHPMLNPCSSTCKKKCTEQITEEERQELHSIFWSLDRQRRRDFIAANVVRQKVARKNILVNTNRRNATLTWKLDGKKVCKTMFLRTIGYTNDQVVVTVMKSTYMANIKPGTVSGPDMRGKHMPSNAFPSDYKQELKNFILSYNPLPSHYNLAHAPNRKYLPVGVTFKRIFKDFDDKIKEENKTACSWTYFFKIVKALNISSSIPDQDKCTKCVEHSAVHPDSKVVTDFNTLSDNHNCDDCGCQICVSYKQHYSNKSEARKHLKECQENVSTSGGKSLVITVDMQKVITMPKLSIKDFFFSRKLVLFNETFAVPGPGHQASYCLLWHEAEGGRKAFNVATAYILFFKKYARDFEEIFVFADNCNAQNKNRILFSSLIRYINDKDTATNIIKFEYLEPGHTYMAADSVHASISTKLNSAGDLFDLEDYIQTIETSRQNLHVHAFGHQDIIIFENETKVNFPKDYNISQLKVVEFRRGFVNIFAKNNYLQQDFKECNIFKKTLVDKLKKSIATGFSEQTINCVPKQDKPRGISQQKKTDLLKILPCIPGNRRKFIEDLHVEDNILDLDLHRDIDI